MTPYYQAAGVTLYCSDSREIDFGAGTVITDPPFNVGIRYTAFHLGKVSLDGVGRDVSLTGLSAILLVSTTFLWGYLT